uniref:Uncharacterized protein n=1 Tax=Steinernema glaseri TaxID=37863 RepID=A0A1I7Y7D5_9BILA
MDDHCTSFAVSICWSPDKDRGTHAYEDESKDRTTSATIKQPRRCTLVSVLLCWIPEGVTGSQGLRALNVYKEHATDLQNFRSPEASSPEVRCVRITDGHVRSLSDFRSNAHPYS